MFERNKTVLISVIAITAIVGLYFWGINSPKVQSTDDLILKKLSEIETDLDSIRNKKDSIKTVIITVDKEIIKNNKTYEKVVNNIINNSDSVNIVWIDDYIKRYIEGIRGN